MINMDPNLNPAQTNQMQQAAAPMAQPTGPTQTAAPVQSAAPQMPPVKKEGNKTMLLIILVILVVVVLGVLYFLALNFNNPGYQASQITPIPQKATSPTPSVQTQTTEVDIDKIDLGNPDQDINSINSDLGQL